MAVILDYFSLSARKPWYYFIAAIYIDELLEKFGPVYLTTKVTK